MRLAARRIVVVVWTAVFGCLCSSVVKSVRMKTRGRQCAFSINRDEVDMASLRRHNGVSKRQSCRNGAGAGAGGPSIDQRHRQAGEGSHTKRVKTRKPKQNRTQTDEADKNHVVDGEIFDEEGEKRTTAKCETDSGCLMQRTAQRKILKKFKSGRLGGRAHNGMDWGNHERFNLSICKRLALRGLTSND